MPLISSQTVATPSRESISPAEHTTIQYIDIDLTFKKKFFFYIDRRFSYKWTLIFNIYVARQKNRQSNINFFVCENCTKLWKEWHLQLTGKLLFTKRKNLTPLLYNLVCLWPNACMFFLKPCPLCVGLWTHSNFHSSLVCLVYYCARICS